MCAALTAMLAPVAPCHRPPAAALGRVLAAAVVAPGPVPARAIALRPGWAVAAAETEGASPFSPVPLPGSPALLAAGDALPPGMDAVLDPFDAEAAGPLVMALQPVAPGDGVRAAGADVAPGQVIRAAGERLGPRDLPALAALGVGQVALRIPRLLLRHADPAVAALLAGWARAEGADCDDGPPDLVLTDDPAMEAAQAGLGARPGLAAGIGRAGGVPALLLPRLAEDAVAAWVLLGLPALRCLAGAAAPAPLRLRLSAKVASAVGMAELVPLALDGAGGAVPLAVGALPLGALARAGALLVVPPQAEGYEAGAVIEALPLA